MPGDKISRVRAIRKWLEKAEKSFSQVFRDLVWQ